MVACTGVCQRGDRYPAFHPVEAYLHTAARADMDLIDAAIIWKQDEVSAVIINSPDRVVLVGRDILVGIGSNGEAVGIGGRIGAERHLAA